MAANQVKNVIDLQNIEPVMPSSSQSKDVGKNKTQSLEINSRPVCLIVLGMAGSGKTSFVKRFTQLGSLQNMMPYVINLDPACQEVPYHANIGKL